MAVTGAVDLAMLALAVVAAAVAALYNASCTAASTFKDQQLDLKVLKKVQM